LSFKWLNILYLSALKKLAGDTMIYGVSSIVGRFVNLLLLPIYTYTFQESEYGILSNLLAYVAFFQVLLTYGMETSYFRFASKSDKPNEVFGTSMAALSVTSLLFVLILIIFSREIAGWAGYPDQHLFIVWMGITVALDAVTAIPFAKLRLQQRPIKFAFFKIINIGINIALNLFWILLCPRILASNPDSFVQHLYNPQIGIGYAFLSYMIASVVTLLLFFPDLGINKMVFKREVLKSMLNYGWPILVVGIAGMVTLNIDKILIPHLIESGRDPMYELGVYAACGKLAILMTLFIQAFRFSFEPFLFSHYKNEASKKVYSVIMNYFVIFGLLIFIGVIFYMDILKYYVGPSTAGYHEALKIVPWMLMGNLFMGMFYTQSLWYKLTDQTRFGAIFSIIGGIITLIINVLFIPKIGYMASAIGFFTSSLIITLISYYYGQKHFPVQYDLKKIGSYFLVAIALYILAMMIIFDNYIVNYGYRTLLLSIFLLFIWHNEKSDLKRLLPKQLHLD
jgi:O-antigen/teichoic acid export membrane protein